MIYLHKNKLYYGTSSSYYQDADIKRQFDALCQDFGMSANTAFNIFARSVVRSRSIPFEIQAAREQRR